MQSTGSRIPNLIPNPWDSVVQKVWSPHLHEMHVLLVVRLRIISHVRYFLFETLHTLQMFISVYFKIHVVRNSRFSAVRIPMFLKRTKTIISNYMYFEVY